MEGSGGVVSVDMEKKDQGSGEWALKTNSGFQCFLIWEKVAKDSFLKRRGSGRRDFLGGDRGDWLGWARRQQQQQRSRSEPGGTAALGEDEALALLACHNFLQGPG